MAITKEEVLKMDLKSVHAAVKNPATSAEMQQLLRDRSVVKYVSELMLAAQNREAAVDAEIERTIPPSTDQLAVEGAALAETAVLEPPVESPVAPAPAATEPKKIVREYQVRDEDGTPIGRPTHLEAWTMEEMLEKMQVAHENAVRFGHRMKKQKLTPKVAERTILTSEEISEAARVALEEKDPAKASEAIRATIEAEYQKREEALKFQHDFEEGRAMTNEFLRRHLHDYNPCEANRVEILQYLKENQLDYTLDNLEVAFLDLTEQGDKLVPVKTRTKEQAAVVANPTPDATVAAPAAPAIPVAEVPAAVPAPATPQIAAPSQPATETTVTTPAAAHNVQPAARRPGVNGSLPPGALSAQRPGAPDPLLARKEFLKIVKDMPADVLKKKVNSDPQFVKKLESYGIKVK